MPRPKRIEFEGAWYHVMNRGARRWNIFHDDSDRRVFLNLIGEVRHLWNVEVHAYSLMDNHFHFLVHTPNAGLSKALKHIGACYAQYYNKKYLKDGPLFRSRFKSIIVEKDSYLLSLVRYIHMNPVKAGICAKPEAHAWTSHRSYLKKNLKPEWLVIDEVLGEFASTLPGAVKKFDEFVKKAEAPELTKLLAAKRRVNILGSEGFKDWIKYNLTNRLERDVALPTVRANHRVKRTDLALLKYVLDEFCIKDKSELFKIKRHNEAKNTLIYLLRTVNGTSHKNIAEFLGMRAQAVSQALHRLKTNEESLVFQRAEACRRNLVSYVKVRPL